MKRNFGMVFLLTAGIVIISLFPGEDNRLVHPMTNDLAVQPDYMMLIANDYLVAHQQDASIEYMEKAIESMRILERDADSESDLVIEAAIRDLRRLETELQTKKSDKNRINHAFLNALNSLALAQLRESEVYLQEKNYSASKIAMEYANEHLQHAIRFSNSQELEKENELQNLINTIALNVSLPNDQVSAELGGLIDEMNTIVLH